MRVPGRSTIVLSYEMEAISRRRSLSGVNVQLAYAPSQQAVTLTLPDGGSPDAARDTLHAQLC